MKKILAIILTISLGFSIGSVNAASDIGYIDKLMDFPFGVEEFKLKVNSIDYVYFYNSDSQNLYDSFRASDSILKNELMNVYRNEGFGYYQMNGIIDEYNMYVYHANKMFIYIRQKETRYDKQLDKIILNHYTLARQYYDRAKLLISNYPKPKTYEGINCVVDGVNENCIYYPRNGDWYKFY